MDESFGGGWEERSQLSGADLHSLRDLNRRFLELAATGAGEWSCGVGIADIAARVAPLTPAQRDAAANCPYALFDLRFRDAPYWQGRMCESERWSVADGCCIDVPTVDFVRLALFYAWHIVSTASLNTQLLLGMSVDTAAIFRSTTLDRLPSLALTEAAHLTARWSDCMVYWSALVEAASGGNPGVLRRVQLHGLQLAAASRLRPTLLAPALISGIGIAG